MLRGAPAKGTSRYGKLETFKKPAPFGASAFSFPQRALRPCRLGGSGLHEGIRPASRSFMRLSAGRFGDAIRRRPKAPKQSLEIDREAARPCHPQTPKSRKAETRRVAGLPTSSVLLPEVPSPRHAVRHAARTPGRTPFLTSYSAKPVRNPRPLKAGRNDGYVSLETRRSASIRQP